MMRLFDRNTGKLEPVQSTNNQISIFLCDADPNPLGVTNLYRIYSYCVIDSMVQYLHLQGYTVQYSLQLLANPDALLEEEWSFAFVDGMASLRLRPPGQFLTAPNLLYLDDPVDILAVYGDSFENEERYMIRFAANQTESDESSLNLGDNLNVMRTYFAQYHYRKNWQFEPTEWEKAMHNVAKLQAAMNAISTGIKPLNIKPTARRFMAALNKDFDTVKALATLLNLADEIIFRASNGYKIDVAQRQLQEWAKVLGIRLDNLVDSDNPHNEGWQAYQTQLVSE